MINLEYFFFRKKVSKKKVGNQPLSPETLKRVKMLFPKGKVEQVESILVENCGNNLLSWEMEDSIGLERIRYAVLKVSNGNLDTLREMVALAQDDWRDVLGMAGFADDIYVHKTWVP